MLEDADLSETKEASKLMQTPPCSPVRAYFTAAPSGWLHNINLKLV